MKCHQRHRASQGGGSPAIGDSLRADDEVWPAQFGSAEGDPDVEIFAIARAIITQRSGNLEPSAYRDRYQEALRGLIETKLKGLPIKPRQVITPPPIIDLMAALKRGLAQETSATGSTTAEQKRAKPIANRRQRSLLLPVAGGRKKKQEPKIGPAGVVMRPGRQA